MPKWVRDGKYEYVGGPANKQLWHFNLTVDNTNDNPFIKRLYISGNDKQGGDQPKIEEQTYDVCIVVDSTNEQYKKLLEESVAIGGSRLNAGTAARMFIRPEKYHEIIFPCTTLYSISRILSLINKYETLEETYDELNLNLKLKPHYSTVKDKIQTFVADKKYQDAINEAAKWQSMGYEDAVWDLVENLFKNKLVSNDIILNAYQDIPSDNKHAGEAAYRSKEIILKQLSCTDLTDGEKEKYKKYLLWLSVQESSETFEQTTVNNYFTELSNFKFGTNLGINIPRGTDPEFVIQIAELISKLNHTIESLTLKNNEKSSESAKVDNISRGKPPL